ncbi:MAG: arylsulfatase [Puniceicoccaceae bacterium]|nr:arylsulfatase [Puniceicoccaceae bacterium]
MTTSNRPHILLITTDQQRFDALGINGNPVLETPNLDRLAATGTNFSRCYSTCPVCIPARRTLLSGQHPTTHGLRGYQDGLDWDPPFTMPGLLSAAGYHTQLVGKLHMHPLGKRYGFDHMVLSDTSNWRPTSSRIQRNDYVRWLRRHGVEEHPHLHGIGSNSRLVNTWPLEDRYHHNNWLAQEAAQFLCEDRDPKSPFFMHLSFFQPHPPLVPTASYLERYERKQMPGPEIGEWAEELSQRTRPGLAADSAVGPFDEAIIKRAQAAYYALINHIDDCVAYVLDRWREHGNPRANEPLYVIYSSDHGEMLGDHHLFRKNLGYEGSSHIPFFISGFNVDLQPGSCETLCSWEDVLPTVADMAGLTPPGAVDGRSLLPALRGESVETGEPLFGMCHGLHDNYFLVNEELKYIWFPQTGEEQLFNVIHDPKELQDLSADADLLSPMRDRMDPQIRTHGGVEYNRSALRPCGNRLPEVFLAS